MGSPKKKKITYYGCCLVDKSYDGWLPDRGRPGGSPRIAVFPFAVPSELRAGDTFALDRGLEATKVAEVVPIRPGLLPRDAVGIVRLVNVPLDGLDCVVSGLRLGMSVEMPRRSLIGALLGRPPQQPSAEAIEAAAKPESDRMARQLQLFVEKFKPRWILASPLAKAADKIAEHLFAAARVPDPAPKPRESGGADFDLLPFCS